jgi:hypothetical protein
MSDETVELANRYHSWIEWEKLENDRSLWKERCEAALRKVEELDGKITRLRESLEVASSYTPALMQQQICEVLKESAP